MSAPEQMGFWGTAEPRMVDEAAIVAVAMALCDSFGEPGSRRHLALWRAHGKPPIPKGKFIAQIAAEITRGRDPLGEAFCAVRSPETRREVGATYTPDTVVRSMVEWASKQTAIERVVDPGCGSARFLRAAAPYFPKAALIGVENDPLAALISDATLAASGLAERSRIVSSDFRSFRETISGRTLYLGNPPYVRHHRISVEWKQWLSEKSSKIGFPASQLAGLHVYFYLSASLQARAGDLGVFITASEWLDVNYGSLVRHLLLNDLGGRSITVVEPSAQPFPDAATTAAITTFEVGSRRQAFSFRRVNSTRELSDLENGHHVSRERLSATTRWSYLTHMSQKAPDGFVELGELCRVHRGQVTGANAVWIAGHHSEGLPKSVLYPAITRAKEVIAAGGRLDDLGALRCVIDIPIELDVLSDAEKLAIQSFLRRARALGVHRGYVAKHRKAWWAVGLRAPAPIISTYMARRPPAFVINAAGARHINIAHGLYPRAPLCERSQNALVRFLQNNVSRASGRTYAGGLTKFEPREMERIVVPSPQLLASGAYA